MTSSSLAGGHEPLPLAVHEASPAGPIHEVEPP